jgi:hypothetical protein
MALGHEPNQSLTYQILLTGDTHTDRVLDRPSYPCVFLDEVLSWLGGDGFVPFQRACSANWSK